MTEQAPPEAIEAALALVLRMGAYDYTVSSAVSDTAIFAEARRIAALLPKPVDEEVLAVRAILHAHQRAMTPPDSGWGNMSYAEGSYDHLPQFQAALAAYRAAVSTKGRG